MPEMQFNLIECRLLHEIAELPAASAIACFRGTTFLIGDSSLFLHVLDEEGRHVRFPLSAQSEAGDDPLPKAEKPDFEALVLDPCAGMLLVLPSGSKPNRMTGAHVDVSDASFPARAVDVGPLYSRVMCCAAIDAADFNIEGGGVLTEERWFLLNRGNGPGRKNLIILLEGRDLPSAEPVAWHRLNLPEVGGVPATSTDGFASDGMLFVVAAAERTDSTFEDGAVAGSLIACFDLGDFTLKGWCLLPVSVKFEGICLAEAQSSRRTLLLCTDRDDPALPGQVFRVVIDLISS